MMPSQDDLVIRAHNGREIAVVEIRNRQELTVDIAMAIRRSLLEHGFLFKPPYFLLLSQEVGYLWTQKEGEDADSLPTAQFGMEDVVSTYFPHAGVGTWLRESEFAPLIYLWLSDLTIGDGATDIEPQKSLARSGLLDAIADGTVVAQLAA